MLRSDVLGYNPYHSYTPKIFDRCNFYLLSGSSMRLLFNAHTQSFLFGIFGKFGFRFQWLHATHSLSWTALSEGSLDFYQIVFLSIFCAVHAKWISATAAILFRPNSITRLKITTINSTLIDRIWFDTFLSFLKKKNFFFSR